MVGNDFVPGSRARQEALERERLEIRTVLKYNDASASVRLAEERLAEARSTEKYWKKNVERAKALKARGMGNSADVSDAQERLFKSQLKVLEAMSSKLEAKNRLEELVNIVS